MCAGSMPDYRGCSLSQRTPRQVMIRDRPFSAAGPSGVKLSSAQPVSSGSLGDMSELLRWIGATLLGVWTIKHAVSPLDRWIYEQTGGRRLSTGRPLGRILLLTTRPDVAHQRGCVGLNAV